MLLLAILFALPMGLLVGLLGGGGSILTLPVLVYVLGLGTKEAIATSLVVVGLTSAVGAVQYARAGNVRFSAGLYFGGFAMLGAYLGGILAGYLPGQILMLLFAGLMVVVAIAMVRPGKLANTGSHPSRPAAIVVEGLAVGALTGLVGAGGGFVVVPTLVLLAGMPMRAAIGTSLFIITLNSFAGLLGHLDHVSVDLALALAIAVPAILGSFVGACLSRRVGPDRLRRGFAYFVLAMAVFMIGKNAPMAALAALVVAYWPAACAVASALVVAISSLLVLRHDG